ncbi:MAG: hypothetical protein ACREF3_05115, partial [Acetobacteraceae bacterium]
IETATGNSNFTTGFEADPGVTAKNITIHDLYIDPTGAVQYTGMWLFPTGYYGDHFGSPTSISNVTNMVSGATYTTLPTAQHYFVGPDANGYTPSLSDIYSVSPSQASGTLDPGNTLTITLHMDEPYIVTGKPSLALNTGGDAIFVGGSGSNSLVFSYTVSSTDTSVTTLAVTGVNIPPGSSVKDAVGNAGNLSGAVRSFSGLGVDPPVVGGASNTTGSISSQAPAISPNADATMSFLSAGGQGSASSQGWDATLHDALAQNAGSAAQDLLPGPGPTSAAPSYNFDPVPSFVGQGAFPSPGMNYNMMPGGGGGGGDGGGGVW